MKNRQSVFMKLTGMLLLAVAIFLTSHVALAQVDANATAKTKALYSNLKKIQMGNTFLFGQEFFNSFRYSSGAAHGDEETSDSKTVTGSHPALLGSDFHYYLDKNAAERGYHTDAVKWAFQQGYIVTFDWHISARGTTSYEYTAAVKDLANNIVNDLNGDRAWFYGELDKAIDIINKDLVVGQDTIPIIFRPLHEMNGNWFWWGSAATNATNYKLLYALMVDYIKARTKSVLFCWSPNIPFNASYYPGNEYVDVVGIDGYEFTTSSLRTQVGLVVDHAEANNKVAVIAETGNRVGTDAASTYWKNVVLPGILEDPSGKAKRIAWVLTWINASWSYPYVAQPGSGAAAKQSFIDFKNSSSVLFGDEIPDMYTITEEPEPEPVAVIDDVLKNSKDVQVYPVPSNGIITIELQSFSKPVSVNIYDMKGKLVHKTESTDAKIDLNTNGILKSGAYIVVVSDRKKSLKKKLLVN